ncbi:hypothetical protein ACFE33_15565 (plasmid) [Falsihalocynthiibacter sp. SS001]|uniref:hypothetical protein n=1 Tax=Falsihalocynthiibacter sp. SS001 TaxID=3349698 RepID=UPI0036D27F6B
MSKEKSSAPDSRAANAARSVWDALNPEEPSTKYLVIWFAVAITVFAVGFAIGHT